MLGLGLFGRGFGLSRLVVAEMAYVALYTARTRAFLCNGKTLVMDPFSATTAAANVIEQEGSYQIACHML